MGKDLVAPNSFLQGSPRAQAGIWSLGWAWCPGPRGGVARAEEEGSLPALSMGLSGVVGEVLSP